MKKTIIVSLTTLFLASLIFVLTISGKPETKVIIKPKTKVVFVCNSASSCKTLMDAYFKNGFELESVTTQLTQINNYDVHNLNTHGGNFNREYLVVLSK